MAYRKKKEFNGMKVFLITSGVILAILTFLIIILSLGDLRTTSKEDVEQAFYNRESFLLVIGESTCSWCQTYKTKTLDKYHREENHLPIKLIYVDKEFGDDYDALDEFLEKFRLTYEKSPTSYLVVNGIVEHYYEGFMELDMLYQFVIPEDAYPNEEE